MRGFLVVLFLTVFCVPATADAPPEFTVHNPPIWPEPVAWVTENGNVRTLSNFKGKVILLNVWATWCTPCVREMPQLDKLQWRYGDAGLQVIAISQDEGERQDGADVAAKLRAFYNRHGIRWLKIYHDPAKFVQPAFATTTLPTSYLIGRDGQLIATAGFGDWASHEAHKIIEAELRKPSPVESFTSDKERRTPGVGSFR